VLRKLVERRAEFLELEMGVLRGLRLQRLGVVAFGILDFPPPLAVIGAEQVAQDREQPRRQIGAGLERVDVGKRAQQRLLDQIVGAVRIAAKRDGERAQAGHGRQDVVTQGFRERHQSLPLLLSLVLPPPFSTWGVAPGASSFLISSANRSGTPCRTTSSYMARSWCP